MKKDKATLIVEPEKVEVKVQDRPNIDIPYGKVLVYKNEKDYGLIHENCTGLISLLVSKGFTKFESLKKK